MKNAHYLLALISTTVLIFSLNSCKKEAIETSTAPRYVFSPEELDYLKENTCTTKEYSGAAEDRATGLKGKFWPKGSKLRVRFLNGTPQMKSKVLNYAKTWEQYANITFTEVSAGDADIRVLFGTSGNNSCIGTDNCNVSKMQPTMNLYWTKKTSEIQIKRATLHEFGHVLGLYHEHQNPLANIPWNVPKVYDFYANLDPVNPWSHQDVDENILNTLGWGPAQHTVFDTLSIMAYPVPDTLTTNGFSIPWNTELSALDKEFIGKMYNTLPYIHVRHAADISGRVTFLLDGIYTTLDKDSSIFVPVSNGVGPLRIWECPSGCTWSSFDVNMLSWYKIVSDPDNPNDLSLEWEPFVAPNQKSAGK